MFISHLFRLGIELLNLLRRGPNIGNVDVSRCSKGMTDNPPPVVDFFISPTFVGRGEGVSVNLSLIHI